MRSANTHENQVSNALAVLNRGGVTPGAPRSKAAGDLPFTGHEKIHAAYIHVPFCFHKCHYCDFYSFVETRGREQIFVDRLIAELRAFRGRFTGRVETIFVGGGTPTLLSAELWEGLLAAIHENIAMVPPCEFTVEANPETVTEVLARVLVAGGVNRVSIGAQTFNPVHLKTLERWHDPRNVGRAVGMLRDAGIENINLDLIFGIPGQTLEEWRTDLDAALSLSPEHLSCYSLMYEPNTPLTQKLKAGLIQRVDEDVEAAMYERTMDVLADEGYEHYEISNWAKPERRCRHNLVYWLNRNWWAFGPSASGHVDGVRWKNLPRLADYLERSPWALITDVEELDGDGRVGEELMLRLRLIEGIPVADLKSLLARGSDRRAVEIDRLTKEGLLERAHARVRLTRRGVLLADSVISALL
jgi:oxygen-independent coproporphyrinogen-3 oxidase